MANLIQTIIEIPFASADLAIIAYNVLSVDEEPVRSQVEKKLSCDDNILKAEFNAKLAKQVRVAVTSFFESLHLIVDTINFVGEPEHSGYKH